LALLFFSVAATLFAEASKLPNGKYPYNTFMIPFSVEACKFTVSILLLLRESSHARSCPHIRFKALKFITYAVPAFCYFISNNCMFYIIRDLGPGTFQVTNNLKILSTGVLTRIFLSRHLSWLQWKSLMILAIGSMVTQLNVAAIDDSVKQQKISLSGSSLMRAYFMVCTNVLAAGAGGVFSEKLLKSKDASENITESIHWQNAQLYIFGVLFGLLSLYTNQVDTSKGIFIDFNAFAYATVAALTICGLLVSFIFKYMDNVAKCFVAVLTMICVAFIDAVVKHETVSLQLLLGILLTCIALEQYSLSR